MKKSLVEWRAGKYVLVGIFVTLFDFVVYTILINVVFRDNSLLWLASAIATMLATVVAYFAHSHITWKDRYPGKMGVVKFFIWNVALALLIKPVLTQVFSLMTGIYEFGFMVSNNLGLPFEYDLIQGLGAYVFTAVVVMILNYLFYDKFVFEKSLAVVEKVQGEPKVSIVVPVYNQEKDVEKCLNSLARQSYENIEVILVDDGSTDGSLVILQKFAEEDKRFKVLHQKNAGQSAARNRGLEAASGEYVCFVDSDDEVKKNYVKKLLAQMTAGADLAVCGIHYKRLREGSAEDVYVSPLRAQGKRESLTAYMLYLLAVDGRMYSSVNKMYRAEAAKECRFDEKLNFAEDTKFVLDYVKKAGAGKIVFVPEALYIYNFGTEGSTIRKTAVLWKNWRKSYENLKKWAGKTGAREKFWLFMVHCRWKISYRRSVRRAKKN